MLALSHKQILPKGSEREPRVSRLVDVAVNVEPPKNPWTAKVHCLASVGVEKPAKPVPASRR